MKELVLTALVATVSLVFPLLLKSQSPVAFSLQQAQEYAYQNNYDLKNSLLDVQIAKKLVRQNTAIGLPQINASASYVDNLMIPTTVIPNFLSFLDTTGKAPKFLELQFGTKYQLTAGAQATQLVYNGEYLVGLQTAKAYLESIKQKMLKDKLSVRDLVTASYISVLIVNESTEILDSTYSTVTRLVTELKESYKNGLIEDIDVDQGELNRDNLAATLEVMKENRKYMYNYLRFVMGIKENQEIILTDHLDDFIKNLNREYLINQIFDYNHNIDYTLLKKQEFLTLMQYKLSMTAYQPSLAAFLGINSQALRPKWDFFDAKQPWYTSSNWGLSVNIPIWSSGQRKNSVDQAKLNLDKIKVTEEKAKVGLTLQVETARNEFNKSYVVFLNNQKGLTTSKKIYDKTVIKYKQGVSSSTDLNQKYNQFLGAQGAYFTSMLDLLKASINLSALLEKF